MRLLKYGMMGLGIAAIGAVIIYHVFFRLPHPKDSGNISLEGLTADVEVRFDESGRNVGPGRTNPHALYLGQNPDKKINPHQ